jgi:hypothetical protein
VVWRTRCCSSRTFRSGKATLAAGSINSWSDRVSAGELRLNPIWDELRDDPRFDKIVAEAALPITLD